jgi:hypothetical protein
MVVAMGCPFRGRYLGPGGLCSGHRSERVFDSFTEQVFGVKGFAEHLFSEQVFDLEGEHLYALHHV